LAFKSLDLPSKTYQCILVDMSAMTHNNYWFNFTDAHVAVCSVRS
jgi:hypothetical protein